MEGPALRKALVSGQTLEQIATSKNVTLQTVQDALKAAYGADIDQAVKDGLIPQDVADQMKSRLNQAPAAPNATPPAEQGGNPQPPRNLRPEGRFLRVAASNQANTLIAAAKAINISCADLVKGIQGGQSIAQVATSKNVQPQVVIDAIVNAYKTALAQDVQEGLITQAQADGRMTNLLNRAGALVFNARQGGQGGPRGNGFGGRPEGPGNNAPGGRPGGRPGRGNGQGGPGDNGTPQPQGTAAAPGTSS